MGKFNGWTKVILAALASGLLSFFIGKATEAGQYKEKVDSHDQRLTKLEPEVQALEANAAAVAEAMKSIKSNMEDMKGDLREALKRR